MTYIYACLNYISFFVLILAFATVGWLIYLVNFDANPPVIYNNLPWSSDKIVYNQGDTISVTADLCVKTMSPNTSRVLLVGKSYTYVVTVPTLAIKTDAVQSAVSTGCLNQALAIVTITNIIVPDQYHLEGTTAYQVNPFARRMATWRSTDFIIKDEKGNLP